jgi:hypothetical protein
VWWCAHAPHRARTARRSFFPAGSRPRRSPPPSSRLSLPLSLTRRRDQNASFLALRDVAATKALYPGIQDLTKWCAKNKEAIAKLA